MPTRVYDVVSVTSLDTKPRTLDTIEVLLLLTDGAREKKIYDDLNKVREDFPDVGEKPSKAYRKIKQLFDQGKGNKGRFLFGKVTVIGIAKPETPPDLINALESIRLNYDDWYAFGTDLDDTENQEALIAYADSTEPSLAEMMMGVEDNRKIYFGQTTDKEFPQQENGRSVMVYVNDLDEEGDFAYLGNVGGMYPESVNWKFMRPNGVTVADLSIPEKRKLHENRVNYMSFENRKHTYMKQGQTTNGEFIDVVIGADFLNRQIVNEIYEILVREKKIPYNNTGFTQVSQGVTTALDTGVGLNIIDIDPESKEPLYNVQIPKFQDIEDDNMIRSRVMPDILWQAQIQGSVNAVTVQGVLTVKLAQ